MKELITATLTLSIKMIDGDKGDKFLQSQIQVIAKDLQEQYEYKSIEYVDHEINSDEIGSGEIGYTITYEVEI